MKHILLILSAFLFASHPGDSAASISTYAFVNAGSACVDIGSRDDGGFDTDPRQCERDASDSPRSIAQIRPTPPSKRGVKATAKPASKPSKAPTFVWPTAGRKILRKYGERTNPTTRTVTVNPGIDIAAKKGTTVRSAASGKVSLISWLPSFGTFVIVEHSYKYRSVYANLASTAVRKGEIVRSGARIGTVGSSRGVPFLHFEIWRDTTRLDPSRLLQASK